MNKPFQRIGSGSNAQAGRDFELAGQRFFAGKGLLLDRNGVVRYMHRGYKPGYEVAYEEQVRRLVRE